MPDSIRGPVEWSAGCSAGCVGMVVVTLVLRDLRTRGSESKSLIKMYELICPLFKFIFTFLQTVLPAKEIKVSNATLARPHVIVNSSAVPRCKNHPI
eukprot:g27660.t1